MTKAAATRWLSANVGATVETVQTRTNGGVWNPGPRTLTRSGNVFTLKGSRVTLDAFTDVLSVSPDALVIDWHDEDGRIFHVTKYSIVKD